jgi:hypothetical protein
MVDKKQIQVGNWLRDEEGTWGTVKSIGERITVSFFSDERSYLQDELSGIVVNRNILSLCDFLAHNERYRHKETFVSVRYFGDGDLIFEIPSENEEFAFVHEFQNLFFKATGMLLKPNLIGI